MDIVGPFDRAPHECRYAITLIDYYSRWPEIAFVPSITSQSVINFLLQVFSREGYPTILVTDNGPQFRSQLFEDFLQDRGIRHTYSSVYCPQANGLVERFNRVCKDYVQLSSLEQRPLRPAVLECLAIYRATPHATTGVSPAVLLHGRPLRTRLNIVGMPLNLDNAFQAIQDLRSKVHLHQEKMKTYADLHQCAKEPAFQVGQFVRVKVKPTSKAQPSYSKPLKIIKKCESEHWPTPTGHVVPENQIKVPLVPQRKSTRKRKPPEHFGFQ
ncbi:uncharacterized protein K02A2.6-like [Ornithodoros turicata]|uniref:uncharacterized protein K02A2.6-like n=1 Tax=Ornithodoros turicata TaxID=34597 RepID=UPI003138D469